MNFDDGLKELIGDLDNHRKSYEGLSESKDMELDRKRFFKGKAEAYGYAVKKLNDLLKWHGKME